MKNKLKLQRLVQIAIVAAIYVVLTVSFGSLSYGPIQFRISEVLVLLVFFNPDYAISLILGCFISNCFSSYPLDIVFGTLQTVVSVLLILKTKKLFVASLWPTITSFIIGFEIALSESTFSFALFGLYTLEVMLGEFVVITLIGVPLFEYLKENKAFMELIHARNIEEKEENTRSRIEYLFISIVMALIVLFFTLPVYTSGNMFEACKENLWIISIPITLIVGCVFSCLKQKPFTYVGAIIHLGVIALYIISSVIIGFKFYVLIPILLVIGMIVLCIVKIKKH